MRKIATLLALGMLVATTAFAANQVRISQVYGGGGGSSVWTYDYVELFNSGPTDVNIGGWSLQYGSATGTTGFGGSSTNCAFIPAGAVIPSCGYYLISCGSSGGTGVLNPWPAGGVDYVSSAGPSMAAAGGKLALISNSTFPTPCAGNTSGGAIVDVVGFAANAYCFEGAPTAASSSANVCVRGGAGMTDTDTNSADFTQTPVASVTIHNSQSARNSECLAVPTLPSTWGKVKQIYR